MPTRTLIALLFPCMLMLLTGCQQPVIHRQALPDNRSITVGDPAAIDAEEAANARVRQLLDTRLTMPIEGDKLINVLDAIERGVELPIHVNWASLEAAGVEKDVPIATRAVRDITVRQALELIIEIAGAGAELEPVDYEIRGGIVHVATLRELQKHTVNRIYDIRDLVEPIPTVPRKLGFDDADMTIKLHFPGSRDWTVTTLFDDSPADPRDERVLIIENLVTLIQDNIGRQSDWQAYGGEVSSIREFDGDLIIKTTATLHEQIEQLLTTMRTSRTKARHEFDEQWKKTQTAGLPDLIKELRRMEAKFDRFNKEYFAELEAKRKKTAPE